MRMIQLWQEALLCMISQPKLMQYANRISKMKVFMLQKALLHLKLPSSSSKILPLSFHSCPVTVLLAHAIVLLPRVRDQSLLAFLVVAADPTSTSLLAMLGVAPGNFPRFPMTTQLGRIGRNRLVWPRPNSGLTWEFQLVIM